LNPKTIFVVLKMGFLGWVLWVFQRVRWVFWRESWVMVPFSTDLLDFTSDMGEEDNEEENPKRPLASLDPNGLNRCCSTFYT
jgi:hypothetical protein